MTSAVEPRHWMLRREGDRPLVVNEVGRMNVFKWGRHTKLVRERWAELAASNVPPLPKVHAVSISVTPLHKDRRSPQDPGACAPEAKAAIDGLVDYGLVPDDCGNHVRSILFLPPLVCGVNGLQLDIEVIE